jgi:hypothetical protein
MEKKIIQSVIGISMEGLNTDLFRNFMNNIPGYFEHENEIKTITKIRSLFNVKEGCNPSSNVLERRDLIF